MSNHSVEFEITETGDKLYIFFGGIAAGIAMPPFEFYNAANILKDNKIFFRDFNQSWYQCGIDNISIDIPSTVEFIKDKINELNSSEVFFIGNSMGGFAAILFAKLVGKGEVIAFAPQTFISEQLRRKHGDSRWENQINKMNIKCKKNKILDLKNLMNNNQQQISIFVSKNDELDLIHARHLVNTKKVNIYEFQNGNHNLVKVLKNKGYLSRILNGTFEMPKD